MSQRTERIQDLMSGAWAAIEKGNWSEPILSGQKAFIYSFEAIQELARELEVVSSQLAELSGKVDRGYQLANAVKGYLGIVGATRELTGWEAELKRVLTTFEGP